MNAALLAGVTVLDLASVGPAARTSRWLADYGARVVKVGPPPKQSGVQIVPPFYAYSGHRGHGAGAARPEARESGRDAFLRLAARADVVIESFRPGVVDRLGIGDADVRAVNPGIVYCSTTRVRPDRAPRRSGPATTSTTSRSAATSTAPAATADGGPALPGATVGDAAGGGMQAVIAILAALVHRAATGEGATSTSRSPTA